MGPDTSHADPVASEMTDIIVKTMAGLGFTRPDAGSLVVDGGKKWDAEVEKIRAALREMLSLDACDKF